MNIRPKKVSSTIQVIWRFPYMGWIKFNIDGAARDYLRIVAYVGLFKGSISKYIGNFSFMGTQNSLFTEVMGAILAFEHSCADGFRRL